MTSSVKPLVLVIVNSIFHGSEKKRTGNELVNEMAKIFPPCATKMFPPKPCHPPRFVLGARDDVLSGAMSIDKGSIMLTFMLGNQFFDDTQHYYAEKRHFFLSHFICPLKPGTWWKESWVPGISNSIACDAGWRHPMQV